MSEDVGALRVRVLPDFSGFRGAAAAEGHAAGEGFGGEFVGSIREHWKGLVAGLAVAELGKKAFDFLGESVNAFKESAVGATQLRRIIGGTVEDTSRLRFALHEMGVSNEAVNTIFGRFSRQLEVQSGTTKGLAKLTDQLGFSVRDATGHLLPMTELLPKIADRFKELPDGAQKTALAIQLFGRSGAGMIRFLNQGSEGIKELEKESDKFGNTISTKSVADLAKYGKAHRELTAATEGLKISIGEKLMPVLTTFEVWLAEKGVPALQKFGSWFKDNVIPIILDFAHFIQNDVIPPVQHLLEFLGKHPAVLHAVERGVELLVAAWAAFKIAAIVTKLWEMAAAIGAVGTASATAAVEGDAAVGAEGAAAAGAGRGGKLPGAKFILPVAVTYAIASSIGLGKSIDDFLHGEFRKAAGDAPGWAKQAAALIPFGGGSTLGGPLTGTAIGKLANAPGAAEHIDAVRRDKAVIDEFQKSLKSANILLSSNSKELVGNGDAAKTNRARLTELVDGAKRAADAEYHLTGKTSDYKAALELSIPAIEAAAQKEGFNKEQVDALLKSLGLIPATKSTDVSTHTAEAQKAVDDFLVSLSRIPTSISVPINAYIAGVLPDAAGGGATQILAGAAQGYSGGHAAGGTALPGWNVFGEHGPELVRVPSQSQSFTAQQTSKMTGGPLVNIEHWHGDQVDADGFASVVAAKQRAYMGGKGI